MMSCSTGSGPVSDDAMVPCLLWSFNALPRNGVLVSIAFPPGTNLMDGKATWNSPSCKVCISIQYQPDIFKTAASVLFGKAPRFLLDLFLEFAPRIWTFHTALGTSDGLHPGRAAHYVLWFFFLRNDLLPSAALSYTGIRISRRSAHSGYPHSCGLDGVRVRF